MKKGLVKCVVAPFLLYGEAASNMTPIFNYVRVMPVFQRLTGLRIAESSLHLRANHIIAQSDRFEIGAQTTWTRYCGKEEEFLLDIHQERLNAIQGRALSRNV